MAQHLVPAFINGFCLLKLVMKPLEEFAKILIGFGSVMENLLSREK
jgi:hypothetical protein